ncbi:arsenate reductase/protein-tyrosine-phosphatase family protein [Nocardia sp. X0981]
MTRLPSVLFVCVHNAGRSRMAAGFLAHLAGGSIEVRSAGSAPTDAINPVAVKAMAEVGIDITAEFPKVLTAVRPIRDEIRIRVEALITELAP